MKTERNYLEGIYDIIYSDDTKVENDGIEIIDDDEEIDSYEPEWGEDVEIIDEDYDEDECYIEELGDGFIPLPQGDDVEVDVIVIDENYVPDEYEADVCGNYSEGNVEIIDEDEEAEVIDVNAEMSNYTNKKESSFDNELKRLHEASEEDSVINTPKTEPVDESLGVYGDRDTDKIAKSVAKEYMDRSAEQSVLPGEEVEDEVETAWIEEDMFGNDIGSIITDAPEDINIEDTDYIDGSFEDWANQNGVSM